MREMKSDQALVNSATQDKIDNLRRVLNKHVTSCCNKISDICLTTMPMKGTQRLKIREDSGPHVEKTVDKLIEKSIPPSYDFTGLFLAVRCSSLRI